MTTITFYVLTLVTVMLQLTMYYKRAKFLRTLKGNSGPMINLNKPGFGDFETMFQIIFPVKLEIVQGGHLLELRRSAVRLTTYWIISLLMTLTAPIVLYNLSE